MTPPQYGAAEHRVARARTDAVAPAAGSPRRLLVVATGNITNAALVALFEANLAAVVGALDEADFSELGPEAIVVHKRRGDPLS